HTETVDVTTRVHVEAAHLRLLRTDICWGADKLLKLCVDRLVREITGRGLGNPEINHLGHWHTIMKGDKDVRRFYVAMNDALLVRVLNGVANGDKDLEPFNRRQIVFIAISRDGHTAHEFHHEIWAARLGRARIEDLGDVGMVH